MEYEHYLRAKIANRADVKVPTDYQDAMPRLLVQLAGSLDEATQTVLKMAASVNDAYEAGRPPMTEASDMDAVAEVIGLGYRLAAILFFTGVDDVVAEQLHVAW